MLRTAVIICFALYLSLVHGWEDNNFNGITQVALVVPNLQEATKFYTDLGGMLVPKLSTDGIWGDSHYYRLFQTQLIDILTSNGQKSTITEGVVDIKTNGQWKLRWNMIMFGNFMLQLMQYVRRDDSNIVWTAYHGDGNGAAKVTLEHIALWGQEHMNLRQLAQELRTTAGPGSTYQKKFVFNSVKTVENREEQYNQPIDSLLQLDGELLVSDGTQNERLELSTTIGEERKENHIKVFCQNRSPSPMVMDNWKSNRLNIKSWMGLHHVGVVVDKWDEAHKFYTEVMGGKQFFTATFPPGLGEFQDDLLDAFADMKTNSYWGIPDFSQTPKVKQEINFMAFENTYLETNFFYTGNNASTGTLQDYRWSSLSPAYTRTIIAGFGVKPSKDLNEVVRDIETRSAAKGMSQVKANRAVSVTSADQTVSLEDYSEPLTEGDLKGYNYVLLRGPSQEPLFIVSYQDKALAALKEAMIRYQAKSGMFTETNPWKQDGFKSKFCCNKFNVCNDVTDGFTKTAASVITVIVALSFGFVLKV